jgi:hypothetical protein
MGLTSWHGQECLLLSLSVGIHIGQTTAAFDACSGIERSRGRGGPVGVSRGCRGVQALA